MVDIIYNISIVLRNIDTNLLIPFSDTKTFNTGAEHNDCIGTNFLIYKGNIYSLLGDKIKLYAANNNIAIDTLEVVSFDVTCDNEYVKIIYKDDDNLHINLDLEIYAYYNDKTRIDTPRLEFITSEPLQITWGINNDIYAHKLLDEEDNLIADIPVGQKRYVETDLKPNTRYQRKIVSYNSNTTSDYSPLISVFTAKEEFDFGVTKFNPIYEKEDNVEIIEDNFERLKAFQSGVGDGLDLKVYKTTDTYFNDKFNLMCDLHGVYYKDTKTIQKTSFDYRIGCTAKYDTVHTDGFVKYKLEASTYDEVKIRVYRYAAKKETVRAKITAKVSYLKLENGIWMPKFKTVSSEIYSKTFDPGVDYKSSSNASLVPFKSTPFIATNIKYIIDTVVRNDQEIRPCINAGKEYTIFDYSILDDYSFGSGTRWTSSSPREFKDAEQGTIRVHSDNITTININSPLYMSGYAENQLYDCERTITKRIDSNSTEDTVILTKAEIDNMVLTNFADRGHVYVSDGNNAGNIVTKVEIISKGSTVILSDIDVNRANVLTAKCNHIKNTPELEIKFNDVDTKRYISTKDILNDMTKDYKYIYDYTLTITDCSNNIKFSNGYENEMQIYPGQLFIWQDDYMSSFYFEALSNVKVNEYSTIYPAKGHEPLHGICNNVTNLDGEYIRKNMTVQAPEMLIDSKYYDQKFNLIIENINPVDSQLKGTFHNENIDGTTKVNGDFITFVSEASKIENKKYTDLLDVQILDKIVLFDDSTIKKTAILKKPSAASLSRYSSYEIELYATSTDINISDYNKDVVFDDDTYKVDYKLRVMKDAASMWSPLIHNGYYYLNQDEHYLFSESYIDGVYEDKIRYMVKNIDFNIVVSLSPSSAFDETKLYSLLSASNYNLGNDLIYNGFIYPKPIEQSKYYNLYAKADNIIAEILFDGVVSEYSKINYVLANDSKNMTLYIRSFDLDFGNWSEWVIANQNEKPVLPLSHKVQFRAVYEPLNETTNHNTVEKLLSYSDFLDDYDKDRSSNIYMLGGYIQTDKSKNGIFHSKIIDYVVSTKLSVDTYYTVFDSSQESYINISVAGSDNIDSLYNNPNWTLMDGITEVSGRYFRYRIEINNNVKIININKSIKTKTNKTKSQGLKNVSLEVIYQSGDSDAKTVTLNKSYDLEYDCKEKVLTHSILYDIDHSITSLGYSEDNILDVTLSDVGDDIEAYIKPIEYDVDSENIHTVFSGWSKIEKGNNNYWILDDTDKSITYNKKNKDFVGYVSPTRNKTYSISCSVSSVDSTNNPIGIIIAYEKDSIGNEHILSVLVSPSNKPNENENIITYSIYYNYGMENQRLVKDYSMYVSNSAFIKYWNNLSRGIIVSASRNGNVFTISRSQLNEGVVDKSLEVTLNITDYKYLSIFKDKTNFGFCNVNQLNSKYSDIYITISDRLNSAIYAKSKQAQVINYQSDFIEVTNNKATLSPLPKQFAPILVSNKDKEPFTRVHFVDDKGNPSLVNEEVYSDISRYCVLTYTNIDTSSLEFILNDESVNLEYELKNNFIFFKYQFKKEDILKIRYKLNNSFIVMFFVEHNQIELEFNNKVPLEKVNVKYETNDYDSRYKANNLSLNPIYNKHFEGYIYISDEVQEPKSINAYSNPNWVYANGLDNIVVCFELVDKYNNPIPNEELNISCSYGRIESESLLTDRNGIVRIKYYSSIRECVDVLRVYHLSSGISKEYKITNMEVI